MLVRVFDDDHAILHLAELLMPPEVDMDMTVLTYQFPGEVCEALACLHWDAGTAAVVDLNLHGQLGEDVVTYLAAKHPVVGLWGITGLCPRDWPAWATESCRRIFHKDGSPNFFRHLVRDIERFVEDC